MTTTRDRAVKLLAERLDADRPKEDVVPTMRAYAAKWLADRPARSAKDEGPILERHVFCAAASWFADMPLERVRTADVRKLIEQWRATEAAPRGRPSGQPLSSKTVANIYAVVRQIVGHAHRREVIARDPFAGIDRREVPRKPRSRRSRYALEAIRAVLTSEAVHPVGRVFSAIAFLTGARQGEICGLRWSDWDIGAEPLTCLTIDKQYDGRPLKSDEVDDPGAHARKVPVHPALAEVLTLWWREGFALVYGRPPRLEDPIVPSKGLRHYTRAGSYELFQRAIERAGVANLALHVTRHTFISVARRRAGKDVVEKITHNAVGETIDQYTHKQWDELCEAVSLIDLNVRTPVSLLVTRAPQLLTEKVAPPGVERLDADRAAKPLTELRGVVAATDPTQDGHSVVHRPDAYVYGATEPARSETCVTCDGGRAPGHASKPTPTASGAARRDEQDVTMNGPRPAPTVVRERTDAEWQTLAHELIAQRGVDWWATTTQDAIAAWLKRSFAAPPAFDDRSLGAEATEIIKELRNLATELDSDDLAGDDRQVCLDAIDVIKRLSKKAPAFDVETLILDTLTDLDKNGNDYIMYDLADVEKSLRAVASEMGVGK